MKVILQLTSHKTTLNEQAKKVTEEYKELMAELNPNIFKRVYCFFKGESPYDNNRIIQESIDLSKASGKLSVDHSNRVGKNFYEQLTANEYNNKIRGYHA